MAAVAAVLAVVTTTITTATAKPQRTSTSPTSESGPSTTVSSTTNLLTGAAGTFDTDTGGWVGNSGVLGIVRSPVYAGRGALSVRTSAGAVKNTAALSGIAPSSWTAITAGSTYRATVQLRAATTGRTVQLVFSWFDARGASAGYTWGTPATDRSGAWTESPELVGSAPANASYVSLGVIWYGTDGNEVHYLDSASLVASPSTASPALLGVFDPPFGNTGDPTQLRAMEAWQGKHHAVVGLYTNFEADAADRLFTDQLPATWAEGSVPMVSWMPWIGNDKTVDYDAQIASGQYDAYLADWAGRMKQFLAGPDSAYGNDDDRRAYVRFAHEGNGNWYPYSPAYGGASATSYVAMWRHVHDVVTAGGLDSTRLSWVWSMYNDTAYPGPAVADLYPGDAYVDWVGIDGYNWGNLHEPAETWETPAEVFGAMTTAIRRITTKPLSVDEVGATTSGRTVSDKAAWITQYFDWAAANDVRMTMWFNDYPSLWAVFGGTLGDETYAGATQSYLGYSSYRAAVQASWLVGADRQNARLVTDAQFAGV
jgi:hypothetical protein